MVSRLEFRVLVVMTVDCHAGLSLGAWMVDSVAGTCLHGQVAGVGYEVFIRIRVEGL